MKDRLIDVRLANLVGGPLDGQNKLVNRKNEYATWIVDGLRHQYRKSKVVPDHMKYVGVIENERQGGR